MKLSHFVGSTSISWEEYEQRLDRLAEYIVQEKLATESLQRKK